MNKIINFYIKGIFFGAVFFYSLIAAYYFFNKPIGVGDEALFISDLEYIRNVGWIESIRKNISIPYMLLAYPLSFIFKGFIALRLVNVLLLLILLYYFFKTDNKRGSVFYVYILFYISTIGFFYFGINDILFSVSLTIFLNEVYLVTNNKSRNINLAVTALVVAFFTRQIFIVYLPIIIFGLYILYKKRKINNNKLIIPFLMFAAFLVMNIPSIIQNGAFSFDKKSPPETINVSWTQRQYLTQMMVNSGELKKGQHPSWKQTEKYINTQGKESLPDGVLNGIVHNYKLTINEFFKDFAESIYFGTRQLGLMLIIMFWFLINELYKNRKVEFKCFVPILTLMMLMIFSFIIISNVELRWLIPVFIMTIIYYRDLEKKKNIPMTLINLNYLSVITFSIYGMFRVLY